MARPLRIEYPGAWYHIMNRGRRGEQIFQGAKDYKRFITLLREASEMWRLQVTAYCLMPNHYHLLVQTPDGNLSRCMRHIDGVYTQRFNRTHGIDGPLFRGRYRSILVDADSYLLQLVRYIHRNPLRAGLVDDLDHYPWSSHQAYISHGRSWIAKDFVLAMLAPRESERLIGYRRLMSQGDDTHLLTFFEKKRSQSILGSEGFVQRIKSRFSVQKADEEVPESRELAPEPDVIKRVICRHYRITAEKLAYSKRGSWNEPRSLAIYLCRRLRGDTLKDIGRHFGIPKYSSVSSAIERTKAEIGRNRTLKRQVDEIISLIKSQEQT